METLGGGWVGEEALAIGLCCALVAPDVRSGLLLAVNHSGDSDSTGSIAGNLLGAMHGLDALPQDLLDDLEGRYVIELGSPGGPSRISFSLSSQITDRAGGNARSRRSAICSIVG